MSAPTPIELNQLSHAAQRALGPGPGKTMAARGLMPLPPLDQLAVLYNLTLDQDSGISQAARETASKLPDKLLAGTLADPNNDPRVLDYFGIIAMDKPGVFDAVALNPSTADQTITTLAGRCGAREVDLLSQNEQRLLRTPEIIAAMYVNRKARMSTIDRVVELAVRNEVRVPGLAAWDEIAKALVGSMEAENPAAEVAFNQVLANRDDSELTSGDADQVVEQGEVLDNILELVVNSPRTGSARYPIRRMRSSIGSARDQHIKIPEAPPQWLIADIDKDEKGMVLTLVETGQQAPVFLMKAVMIGDIKVGLQEMPFRDLPMHYKIRAATMGDAFVRAEAVRDANRLVSMAAIKSPGIKDMEVVLYAGNQIVSDDVIRYIAHRREWTKLYGVKVALCRNPKAPISETTRMMPFLRERDLNDLMRSKGVPSAVVAQAKKISMQRRGGDKK